MQSQEDKSKERMANLLRPSMQPQKSNSTQQLRADLIAVTKDGRVTDWNERIALLAYKAGLSLEHIAWEGSPHMVAHRVVDMATRFGHMQLLIDVVAEELQQKS